MRKESVFSGATGISVLVPAAGRQASEHHGKSANQPASQPRLWGVPLEDLTMAAREDGGSLYQENQLPSAPEKKNLAELLAANQSLSPRKALSPG